MSIGNADELEEEHRLAYVGITRHRKSMPYLRRHQNSFYQPPTTSRHAL